MKVKKARTEGFSKGPQFNDSALLASEVKKFLTPLASERVNRLGQVWVNACKDGQCPTWADLDLSLHPDLLNQCFLLEYVAKDDCYYGRFFGQSVVDHLAVDPTNMAASELVEGQRLDQWVEVWDYCRTNAALCRVSFDLAFVNRGYVSVQNGVFPLSLNGEVSQILGLYIWND